MKIGKNVIKKRLRKFKGVVDTEQKQVATGLKVGLNTVITGNLIQFIFFMTFFNIIFFIIFAYLSEDFLTIIKLLPYYIAIILTIIFSVTTIPLSIIYEFKPLKGLITIMKSDIFLLPALFPLGAFVISIILLITGSYQYDISDIIYLFATSFISVLFFFIFAITYITYFHSSTNDLLVYSTNILEKNLKNWDQKGFIPRYEKRKIYNAINIVYEQYKKRTKDAFGEETQNLLRYNTLLKLSVLLSMIDRNDRDSLKKIVKIIESLKVTSPHDQPQGFIKIMDYVDTYAKKFNIETVAFTRESILYRFKKYVILIIYITNLLIVVLNQFFRFIP